MMSGFPPEQMPSDPPPPATTVATSARDRVVAQISEAFANDVLALDELERRVASAYAATTPAELARLTADLPAAVVAPSLGIAGKTTAPARLAAVFGNIERGGMIDVPRFLELRVFCGNIELDLTRARFAAGVTEISVRSLMGNVELMLPPNVHVENYGDSFMSSLECDSSGHDDTTDATCVVRITGRVFLSSVDVSTST